MPTRRHSRLPVIHDPDRPIPGIDPDLEREIRASHLAGGDELDPECYPVLRNISPAFMYRMVACAREQLPVEYVRVPLHHSSGSQDGNNDEYTRTALFISTWNLTWEAGHLRQFLMSDQIPSRLKWLERIEGVNMCLVGDEGHRSDYDLYQPLYHLLPRRTLERYRLPLLKRGHWPHPICDTWADRILPADADRRFARAFAAHVWPLLSSGSRIDAFSDADPLRVLAHNLDFWLPYVDRVAARRVKSFGRVAIDSEDLRKRLEETRAEAPDDLEINTPLYGGHVWAGEQEAWEATKELVEIADAGGQLRALVEDIRSHRVEEDFSDRWSYAREDFERRLYAKRVKRVKISFVELKDTLPVHGAESEVHDNLLWEDFMTLVDPRDRRIIVCLRSGLTRVGDIAAELGYANHSPVSKALARIRARAARLFREHDR